MCFASKFLLWKHCLFLTTQMPNKVNYVLILFYFLTSARISTESPHTYTSEQTSGNFYPSVNSIYKPYCKWGILGREKLMIDDENVLAKIY